MAYQFMTTPTSSNPHIFRKLNNMEEAKLFKKEYNDWIRSYHKVLKEIETMINVQKQVQNIVKLAEETNMMITEIEGMILKASNNH